MAQKLKTALAIFGLSVLAILAAELVARGAVLIDDTFFDADYFADRGGLALFEDADYDAKLMIRETAELTPKTAYQPYVLWRHEPFEGELVTVDEEGNRVTTHNSSRDDALEVWMLGGSSTWGYDAPNDQTIASHLARLLNEEMGVDARVRNLGEHAYVSVQEIILLIRELQSGRRPDAVIFYDGLNDASAAVYWPQVPGTHYLLTKIGRRFERRESAKGALEVLVRRTGLHRVVSYVLRALGDSTDTLVGVEEARELGERAGRIWMENHRIATALGKDYGFTTLFFLQPTLGVGDKPLTDYEASILNGASESSDLRRINVAYAEMRATVRNHLAAGIGTDGIHDITDVFEDVAEPLYIDSEHVIGAGNRIVASKMFETLREELCRETPRDASSHAKSQLAACSN